MKTIDVVFKKDKRDGEIVAILPNIPHGLMIPMYSHFGQHSTCDYGWLLVHVTSATENEYKPLLKELMSVYRNCKLRILKRLPSYKKI